MILQNQILESQNSYHLTYEGLTYPSKAIVGVAFRYQNPSAAALKASEFSGGAATVQRALERLGFEVEVGGSAPEGSEPIAEEAADEDSFDSVTEADAEDHIKRTIRARRGQAAFRNRLLSAYGGRCAITGCDVLAVLEAAHIVPYRGQWTNKVSNGLLLRADIHTLFDCARIGVDPASLEVLVHPDIADPVYRALHGRVLRIPADKALGPSRRALEMRQEKLGPQIGSWRRDHSGSMLGAKGVSGDD
ncbi:HNH endonuclease [Pseudoroseomonas oryzae]|uniref:HNH endonuclease n=1 Tax=Teichococcus oryzae TaxID=1608942 RepID=A0A5B2T990_9PROT|nr:HNH endonuclease [Pseudoroseomonas oryzae]